MRTNICADASKRVQMHILFGSKFIIYLSTCDDIVSSYFSLNWVRFYNLSSQLDIVKVFNVTNAEMAKEDNWLRS